MTETHPYTAKTTIPTKFASKYIRWLSNHFKEKAEVNLDGNESHVNFRFALGEMVADDEKLYIECSAPDEEGFKRVKFVLEDHVVRFAKKKEDLTVTWEE